MLELQVKGTEFFDENTEEYIEVKDQQLVLEHSLISVHKWEQKWETNFLDNDTITNEEFIDYVRCMTINKVNPLIYLCLTRQNIDTIKSYMGRKMTGTRFAKSHQPPSHKIVTAEVLYSQMFSLNIPMECAKWHLSSLLTLIRVCAEENSPKKKMSAREAANKQREINAMRKQKYKTRG